MNKFAKIVDEFREYEIPGRWQADNPFTLVCKLAGPASDEEVMAAWNGRRLPLGVAEFWRVAREARLFEDVDFGQWGLALLSPTDAGERTAECLQTRSNDFDAADIVIGEFLGDSEILVVSGEGEVLVALPLDRRSDWFRPAPSLDQFLESYRLARGDKYWE